MKDLKRIQFSQILREFLKDAVIRFAGESLANRRKVGRGRYWDKPLVGFASGDDPLFKQYKKIIGEFHFTPHEIFEETFGRDRKAKNLTVISWILPAFEDIRESNRNEAKYPSLLWAHARDFGEEFNIKLRNYLVTLLEKKGFRAVAPMNSPYFRWVRSPKTGLASVWSERHAVYAAGLGTFVVSWGVYNGEREGGTHR